VLVLWLGFRPSSATRV